MLKIHIFTVAGFYSVILCGKVTFRKKGAVKVDSH